MPGMDGYQLTREMRANAALRGIYVLLHTSLDSTMNTARPSSSPPAHGVRPCYVPSRTSRNKVRQVNNT